MVLHPLFLFLVDPSSSWQVLVWGLIFKLNSDPGSKIRFKILTGICLSEIKQINIKLNRYRTSLIISLRYAIHIIWPCAQRSVVIFCPKISLAWSEVLRQTKSILEQRESLITTDCRWNKASINYMSKPKCITRPNSFKITKGESIANEMNKMIK